ncbi:MAG: hypothetical protein KDH15_10530 [Rhodocyclaceae bacterium]|nr:hypothetical protein [Rhodocyclaceae bacterium]
MAERNPSKAPGPPLLAWWRAAECALFALAAVNLLGAVLVKVMGRGLHPMFSDPDSALLFLATGLGILFHALLLALMRWRLCADQADLGRPLRRLRSFMRMPLNADFAAQRHRARLRMGGRPQRRPGLAPIRRGVRRRPSAGCLA